MKEKSHRGKKNLELKKKVDFFGGLILRILDFYTRNKDKDDYFGSVPVRISVVLSEP